MKCKYFILIVLVISLLSCKNEQYNEPKVFEEFLAKERAGMEAFVKKIKSMQAIVEKDSLPKPQPLKSNKELIIKGELQNTMVLELFLLQQPEDSLSEDQFYDIAHEESYTAITDMLNGQYDPTQRWVYTDVPIIKQIPSLEYIIIISQERYSYPLVSLAEDGFTPGKFRGYAHVFDLKTQKRIAVVPFSGENDSVVQYDDDHSANKAMYEDIRKNVYFNFCDSLGIKR